MRRVSRKYYNIIQWIILAAIAGLLIVFLIPFIASLIYLYLPLFPPQEKPKGELRAVILDTVALTNPNKALLRNITQILEKAGYKVEVYEAENVTVDLMRKLCSRRYDVIIFRAHSSYTHRPYRYLPNNTVVIFTGERYVKTKYVLEQMLEYLVPSTVIPEIEVAYGYFAITPRFISVMHGKFDNTIVIAMGCNTLYTISMARAFIDKGASVYIGIDNYIAVDHLDKVLYYLIKYLFEERLTIDEAVKKVNEVIGYDPYYKAKVVYYPEEASGIRVKVKS